ncbi:RNA polymerase sigma factor [Coprobacter tertius]|uniref:Sigma-70 family RNA polymerase sigma factor n=1 Tax=Coprobacter tertius TaxID=2944915 RepID=A0ABT1MGJ3_9BACT|nr:sigma-70 family RNA polymerase sigma factor [Coprobacter tertius]MCP9611763.1 sigma-70 family RNA polymerase sigma factor [Coprobacter tertius]
MDNLLSQPDEMLVDLYAKGNNEAFDILLNRHKNRIYTYIYYVVRNRDLTEDIFQETFVKAIVTIKQGRYTENGKFPAWITRIAHNLIIDYYRQEKNENQISNDETEADIFNNKDLSEGTIEDILVEKQIHADIRKLVKALPENQREVLIMRYYKNMSFKEIADATNVSINTALGRMRYAILNIRKLAEEKNITLTL